MYKIKFQKLNFVSNKKTIKPNLKKIFLFYGIGNSSHDFIFLLKKIKLNYQLLIPELPGHNYDKFNHNFSLITFAKLLTLFLIKKKINNLIFFSHSVGGIIPLLVMKNLRRKVRVEKFINYEGNLTIYDTNTVTKKTSMYKINEFNLKFKKLIGICADSNSDSLRLWSESLKKTNPSAFYKISCETVTLSQKKKLLEFFRSFFKVKIYLYGSETVLNLAESNFGNVRFTIKESGHFAFFDSKRNFLNIFSKLVYNNL